MTFESLFEKLDLLIDARRSVERLRELVLQLAIRGKLTANTATDTSSPEQVYFEKAKALNKLRLRAHPVTPAVDKGDFPFPLPASWHAVCLGDLVYSCPTSYGEEPSSSLVRAGVVKVGNIDNQGYFKGRFTDRGFPPDEIESLLARQGDLLVVKSSGSAENVHSGKTALCTSEHDRKIVGSNFVLRLRPLGLVVTSGYLWRVLTSRYSRSWVEKTVQTMTYPNLKWSDFARLPVPLPPLEEQRRIVSKVDELMSLCGRLGEQQKERETRHVALSIAATALFSEAPTPVNLNFLFHRSYSISPVDLRKTVLNLAVQGKLTLQESADESVADLLQHIERERSAARAAIYPKIELHHAPFEIPASWTWVRLGNIALRSDSGWSPQCESQPRDGDAWGVLKVSAVSWGRFLPEENKALPLGLNAREECEVKAGDFLLSRANTEDLVARSVVVIDTPPHLMMSDKLVRFTFPKLIDKSFINLANSASFAREYYAQNASGTSSSMKNVGREVMSNLPIPLPPLKEQRRIVAKADALFVLIGRMEDMIASSRSMADYLTDAIVSQLLAAGGE